MLQEKNQRIDIIRITGDRYGRNMVKKIQIAGSPDGFQSKSI